jgi:23S rRNA pseudouridine1911/1915/1917 synthase
MIDISKLVVLYEDNHLIAVNKPAGWLVQGDETGDMPLTELVKAWIKVRYEKPGDVFLGVIHRLDRPVSGVTLFARTSKGLSRMNELFRTRDVRKTYLAVTRNRPPEVAGTLVHYLSKDSKKNVAHAYASLSGRAKKENAKKASLDYRMAGQIDQTVLLSLSLHTGRPHQIRAQLSQAGCPILGDAKYQSDFTFSDGSIALHAWRLEFEHPIKQTQVCITAPLPDTPWWNPFKPIVEDGEEDIMMGPVDPDELR